jgi:hypothetical protein
MPKMITVISMEPYLPSTYYQSDLSHLNGAPNHLNNQHDNHYLNVFLYVPRHL